MTFYHKQKILTVIGLLISILFILSIQSLAEAEIYKWVDEKGVIHFSDTPPSDNTAEVLPESPVNKIGGAEPIPHKSPSRARSEGMKEEEKNRLRKMIGDYESKIDKSREAIKQYQGKIAELRDKQPFSRHVETKTGSYFAIDDYGTIEEYEKKIEDEKSKINLNKLTAVPQQHANPITLPDSQPKETVGKPVDPFSQLHKTQTLTPKNQSNPIRILPYGPIDQMSYVHRSIILL